MKRLAIIICLLVSVPVLASEGIFFGFSTGLVQGEAGRTAILIAGDANGWEGTIVRGITPYLDLAAAGGAEFSIEGRLLAIDLPPIGGLLTVAPRGFAGLMRLSLGPVRLDIFRRFGNEGERRFTVSVFPLERVFFLAGWEEASPFLALRVNPLAGGALWISILLGTGRLSVAVGGAF